MFIGGTITLNIQRVRVMFFENLFSTVVLNTMVLLGGGDLFGVGLGSL